MLITAELSQAARLKDQDSEKKTMLGFSKCEDTGKYLFKINSSSLDIMQTCWRKTKYSLIDQLVSRKESDATIFGTAIHAALEKYHSGSIKERVVTKDCENVLDLLQEGHDSGEHKGCLICDSVRDFVSQNQKLSNLEMYEKRSISAGVWTLRHYFDTYKFDSYSAYRSEEGEIYAEKKFETNVYEDRLMKIDIFGTIDLVLQDENSGDILICDHKTTSVMGADFLNRLKPNHQYTTYVLGAQKALGFDTNKFMVNGIQVKGMPKTARGSKPNLTRQITTRDADDIKEYINVLRFYSKQLIECHETMNWPLGPVNACSMYSGCQFHGACSAHKTIRENILRSDFF